MMVEKSPVYLGTGLKQGELTGDPVIRSEKRLKQLTEAFARLEGCDPETLLYEVQAWLPVSEGTSGGLFYGLSTVYPGQVGGEFFMTRGHFHQTIGTAEFYWGISGRGLLVLMDEQRQSRAEIVEEGSLHYVPGRTAHRLVNIGTVPLKVGACWPSDAGHDYDKVKGFSVRVFASEEPPGYRLCPED